MITKHEEPFSFLIFLEIINYLSFLVASLYTCASLIHSKFLNVTENTVLIYLNITGTVFLLFHFIYLLRLLS